MNLWSKDSYYLFSLESFDHTILELELFVTPAIRASSQREEKKEILRSSNRGYKFLALTSYIRSPLGFWSLY